jgi:trehalose 6-phosphate synthase
VSRRRLIVVSNRGPLSYGRDGDGKRVVRRGAGGLVTALRGVIEQHDVTWIASALSDEDRVVALEQGDETVEEQSAGGSPYRLRLIAHEPAVFDRYYNVVSNGTLWFLQHYLWGLADAPDLGPAFREAWEEGYVPANEAFADAVCAELAHDPNALVWFHDYHLYRAPSFVRERAPEARLMHFIHIPWAEADYWHVLPEDVRRAVYEGLCANDVVGLHTLRWRRSFLQGCEAITGIACPESKVVARPIAIDPDEFDALKTREDVVFEEQALAAARPEVLILRVDRTEPAKNIVRGFRAYALLLERHPELVGRVGMLALLDPSRQDVPEYAAYRLAIEREAVAVRERFGDSALELRIADNFVQSVAAYKQFDVLFVNPIFDGMNLIAKEGPLVNERNGVLVLSENAGAHEALCEWALTVNPFDLESQAGALYRAVTMTADERRRRREGIVGYVRTHDLEAWTSGLLDDLDRATGAVASRA